MEINSEFLREKEKKGDSFRLRSFGQRNQIRRSKRESQLYSSICLLVKHNGSKSIGDRYFRAVSSFDFAALRLKDSLELVNTLSRIPCCTFYLGKE